MTLEVWAMIIAGAVVLVAGLILAWPRFQSASGIDKIFALAPVFEAVPLAIFAMEHLFDAHDLMGAVPKWIPGALFWTYFFGVALLAAAISFILWRCVRLSATLLAIFFLIIVAVVDLPNLAAQFHDRIFWTLTVRELCFAGGAMVLAGSLTPCSAPMCRTLTPIGRTIVALVMIFYGIEHFFFLHNVPGVPLEKITPSWIPASAAITCFIGVVLILAGIGLFIRSTVRIAAASAGSILVLLVIAFYGPICVAQLSTNPVEGLNYVGDTLLFAATVMLAGFGANRTETSLQA
ncbi:hypothetical protein [Terracidiphilus gabretensis]|uniref:hypothetical protein n=1 Tax=Terracidiphilus gabretensis TaxID=1577687 RepID=UPI00071B208B|nr:hypothetical protein [Terracidiphilus gabretensis]